MKHFILTIILIFISLQIYSQTNNKIIKLEKAKKNEFKLIQNKTNKGFLIQNSISHIKVKSIETDNNKYIKLNIDNFTKPFGKGEPELPALIKLIEVPFNAELEYEIISYDKEIINFNEYDITDKIIPSRQSIAKDIDKTLIAYNEDKSIYHNNKYFSKNLVQITHKGIMRDKNIIKIIINPVQYNPIKNKLIVINNLTIKFKYKNADYKKTNETKSKYNSPFLSFQNNSIKTKSGFDKIVQKQHLTYIIVSDRMFETELAPFIEWKKLKGYHVITAYTDQQEVGNTNASIKAYLKNLYENPPENTEPPTFVLFVGDHEQIPAWNGKTSSSHLTDLHYCEYTDDYLPEVLYGRFSAQTTDELKNQIDKNLMYEKYTMPDDTYLAKELYVAGVDPTYAPSYANGQVNYIWNYYANSNNDIDPYIYLYEDQSGIMNTNNADAKYSIIEKINSGVGIANYTAHCTQEGWENPAIQNEDIGLILNDGKYGLWIGNCCESSRYEYYSCFAETVVRAKNKGAIAYIGGSNLTYWDEDLFWAIGATNNINSNPSYQETNSGLFDKLFHTKENETEISNWYITQGQMIISGNLAVEESLSDYIEYYWEVYNLMGDPSVMPYLKKPMDNTYTINPEMLITGNNTCNITTSPYAYVSLTQNNEYIASGFTDNLGEINLSFSKELTPGEVTLVITAQNYKPIIENITVKAADKPYVSLQDYSFSETPEINKTITINVSFKNLAESNSGLDASNVNAELSIDDKYITIIENNTNVGNIISGETIVINNAFSVLIADSLPDQHVAKFKVIIQDSESNTWESKFNMLINAPDIIFTYNSLNDSGSAPEFLSSPITEVAKNEEYTYNIETFNGMANNNKNIDGGETAYISYIIENKGNANLKNITLNIESENSLIYIPEPQITINLLEAKSEQEISFKLLCDNNIPKNTEISFQATYQSGKYTDNKNTMLIANQLIEDFEKSSENLFLWNPKEEAWITDDKIKYSNEQSKRSGYIYHSQSSGIETTINCVNDGEISFFVKTSCEDDILDNYDYLAFFIDNVEIERWDGEKDWEKFTYPVTKGEHTFSWIYRKDGSMSDGMDCAWIDYISFPETDIKPEIVAPKITAIKIPNWLSINDNKDGTAILKGTAPDDILFEEIILKATQAEYISEQKFWLYILKNSNNSFILPTENECRIWPINSKQHNVMVEPENNINWIKVYSLNGKILHYSEHNDQLINLDFNDIASGIYIVHIGSNKNIYKKRIFIN